MNKDFLIKFSENIFNNVNKLLNKNKNEITNLLEESNKSLREEIQNNINYQKTLEESIKSLSEKVGLFEEQKNKEIENNIKLLSDNSNELLKGVEDNIKEKLKDIDLQLSNKLTDNELKINNYLSSIKINDGLDGKDGIDIEVLEDINLDKSYPKNTYAKYKNGLWKSTKRTEGIDGWICLINGIDNIVFSFDEENLRDLTIECRLSDGVIKQHTAKLPNMIYKGVYSDDNTYEKYDTITHGGSLLISIKDNPGHPTLNPENWKLSVKKGRDGKQGIEGKAGKNGKDGKEVPVDYYRTGKVGGIL